MRPVPWPVISRLLVATLFLVGGLVALAPGGDAQTIRLGTPASTYHYGWEFPEGDGSPGAAVDDASGDLTLMTDDGGDVPVGAAPVHQVLDLVQARLDEPDAETLRLTIQVADLDPQRFVAENLLFGARYITSFELSGRAYHIDSTVWSGCADDAEPVCEPVTAPVPVVRSSMYRTDPNDVVPVGYLPGRVDVQADSIEILIPRWALDGPGLAGAPLAGDAVKAFQVEANGGRFCIMTCGRIGDRLPDDAPLDELHRLVLDSNGARVRFADGRGVPVDEDGDPLLRPLTPRTLTVDVTAGTTVPVPVRVENLVEGKALVLTTVEVVSAHGVRAQVPESLEVPSTDVRKLLVTIHDAKEFALDDPLVLRLELETVGRRPAIDTVTVLVRTVPPLAPESPRLYLHTYSDGTDIFSQAGLDTFAYSRGILNTVADDPYDDGRGAVANSFCFCINNAYGWNSQTGVSTRVELDPDGTGTLHFEAEAPVPGTLMLDPVLFLDDQVVLEGSAEVDLEQGHNTVDVPLRVLEDGAVLEPGTGTFYFDFRAVFRPTGVIGGEFVALAEPVNPRVTTSGTSWLELPVLDPTERFRNATHLSIDLERGTDRVQYLNPGRTTLWNLTVGNHADQNDTVTIRATAPDGWKTRVAPGASYRLAPGESVTVGVQATAPQDAEENAEVQVVVAVASALAEGDTTGAALSAVVTNGAEIEERAYVADNETKARLADKTTTAESPTPHILLAMTGVLACLAARRRSR